MKLSIITPVLNSHEIVRRQLLHYAKMPLPEGVEVILVDDGSDPPLANVFHSANECPARLIVTGDTRPWTEMVAFNRGVEHSEAEYILKADIDYIVTEQAIRAALEFTGDRMDFQRKFGVLDENGDIQDDAETLRYWGLKKKYIGKVFKGHRNQWLMRKSVFRQLGGYNEKVAGQWLAASADAMFFHKWKKLEATGMVIAMQHPLLYSFPNGKHCGHLDFNPHGLFHGLKRQ
jgi:glycosyltransferase involved in cell wall biosynthesis